MIARRDLETRVLDARSRAGLAGAPCPLRRRADATARGRRAAPHQPSPEDVVARPCRDQRPEQAAACDAAPDAAGVTPHTAALAREGLSRSMQDFEQGSAPSFVDSGG